MHVVHVINNLVVGGAERFLSQLAAAQVRLGWRATVLTLVPPNPLAPDLARQGVLHRDLGRARLNDPRLAVDAWRALRALRPHVVHTHLFYADTFGRLGARAAGVPAVVSTEHSTEGGPLSRRRRLGMRCTAGLAHRIVAVSDSVRRSTAQRLRLPVERIAVVPNGIDLAAWESIEPLPRGDLGLGNEHRVVGCVGRLVPSKGYDALLRAVARLHDANLRVLMIGDGPERAALQDLTGQLGIGEIVHWLGWRADVPRLLATLDVFALPSHWEGHSVALLEAMAAGRACLVSDVPELTEVLGDACARIVPGNPDSIAGALRLLLESPARRAALGTAAREAVRGYTIERAAQRYLQLYIDVLRENGRLPAEDGAP